jgi:uncharacterized membrane protein YjjP (DUF1212 family)
MRIAQLETGLKAARLDNRRLQLEVAALDRDRAPAVPKRKPPIGIAIAAMVAGTFVGLAGGHAVDALVAGLGAFSAILFGQWLEGVRGGP